MPLATGGHAEQYRRRTAAIIAAHEKPIFRAHGLRSQRTLRKVVVDAQVAILRVGVEREDPSQSETKLLFLCGPILRFADTTVLKTCLLNSARFSGKLSGMPVALGALSIPHDA
jgi:hypothetical protein